MDFRINKKRQCRFNRWSANGKQYGSSTRGEILETVIDNGIA